MKNYTSDFQTDSHLRLLFYRIVFSEATLDFLKRKGRIRLLFINTTWRRDIGTALPSQC